MIHLNNILNILKLGNNWLNYKHNDNDNEKNKQKTKTKTTKKPKIW